MPQKELWLPSIEENFFAEWGKLATLAKDDSVYVMRNGAHVKVYIPNAGSPEDVLVNNTSYPVSVEERTDTTVEYDVDSFQMPPMRVGHYDAAMLSYDKISSITKDLMGNIGEYIMYKAFTNWYHKQANKYVETSGASDGASDAPGSTTDVKKLMAADVQKAAKVLDLQKVAAAGRILLLPPQMFYNLLDAITTKFEIVDNDGLAMLDREFYGFRVVKVPIVAAVTTGYNGVRTPHHNGATTDRLMGLAYHRDAVSVSREKTFVYDAADRPEYYGDIISAEAWAGSSIRRTDYKGVVPIFQANA